MLYYAYFIKWSGTISNIIDHFAKYFYNLWYNIGNIESFFNISILLVGGILGVKSLLRRKKLKNYLKKWIPKNVLASTKYYVNTRGQQIDPCEYDEISNANNCKITTELVPFFIKDVFANDFQNQYFIVLGDSGTGKTTFMIQLFKKYRKKIRKEHDIEFIPLNLDSCIQEIRKIPNPENIILLLDGLDENSDALSDYEKFIGILLKETERFYKVIITCRTQFFPNEKAEPYETGKISFSLKNKKNVFYKIYISPFGEADIKCFLKKKYPFFFNAKKRKRAEEVVRKSPYLMVRPMLLSYIDDLIQEDTEYEYIFQIYEQLTEKWMDRESVPNEKLDAFSRRTAVHMYRKNTIYIKPQDIGDICSQYNIELREIEAKSRSLLNRNGLGDYKFAHKSIYEYFLAREAMDNLDFRKEHNFSKLDMANIFFKEMSSIYIDTAMHKNPVTGNFTKMELSHVEVTLLQSKYFPAILDSASVRNSFFKGCHFQKTILNNCRFYDCEFTMADFTKKKYVGVYFNNCKLAKTQCLETSFIKCSFVDCDMRETDLTQAYIENCTFTGVNLAFSILNEAQIVDCVFKKATLGPLEYKDLHADPHILKDIQLANAVAELFISNGYQEAKENGVRIVTKATM